jgi:hypothetical protein
VKWINNEALQQHDPLVEPTLIAAVQSFNNAEDEPQLVVTGAAEISHTLFRVRLDGTSERIAGRRYMPGPDGELVNPIDGKATEIALEFPHNPVVLPNGKIAFIDRIGLRLLTVKDNSIKAFSSQYQFRTDDPGGQTIRIMPDYLTVGSDGTLFVGGYDIQNNPGDFRVWAVRQDTDGECTAKLIAGGGQNHSPDIQEQPATTVHLGGPGWRRPLTALPDGGLLLEDPGVEDDWRASSSLLRLTRQPDGSFSLRRLNAVMSTQNSHTGDEASPDENADDSGLTMFGEEPAWLRELPWIPADEAADGGDPNIEWPDGPDEHNGEEEDEEVENPDLSSDEEDGPSSHFETWSMGAAADGSVAMAGHIYSGESAPLITGIFRLSADGSTITAVSARRNNDIDCPRFHSGISVTADGGIITPLFRKRHLAFLGPESDSLLASRVQEGLQAIKDGDHNKVQEIIESLRCTFNRDIWTRFVGKTYPKRCRKGFVSHLNPAP